MLRREPTEEEAEMQRILDARVDAKAKGSVRRKRISRKKRASNLVPWPPISPRVVPDLEATVESGEGCPTDEMKMQ